MRTYLAVDLGGTNVALGLVSGDGRVLKRDRFPIHSERGPDDIIANLVQRLRALASGEKPQGLGVGAAGRIRPAEGLLLAAPNLPGWRNIPLGPLLEAALDIPTRIENDSDLYTLGEWLAGAGQGRRNLVGLTLGTGVGGGLVLDGALWHGSAGTAAEVGHMVVDPFGVTCGCGGRGCLETIASATGLVRLAREGITSGRPCAFAGRPEDLTAAVLHDLARQGDSLALEVFGRAGWALGLALTGIFNLLGLEAAVIGGGMARAFDFIRPTLWAEFSTRVFAVDPEAVPIIPALLGDDAPLVGAAALFEREER